MILSLNRTLGFIARASQKTAKAWPFLVRAIVCWCVGLGVLLLDRSDDFDLRFKIRGNFLKSSGVTLILISEDEWLNLKGSGFQTLRPLKEVESLTDSFFADRTIWEQLLGHLLQAQPKAIGVTFFMGEPWAKMNIDEQSVLRNPKIIWSARVDNDGQLVRPRTVTPDDRKTGLIELDEDGDGYLRRFTNQKYSIFSFPERLLRLAGEEPRMPPRDSALINYLGPSGSFLAFTLTELLFGTLPESALKNRIVIIGGRGITSHTMLTPLGPMPKAEIMANLVENMRHDQWIRTLPTSAYAAFLLGIVLITVWMTVGYSQTMAIVFLSGLLGLIYSLSTYVFDTFFIWVPLIAPTVTLIVTFVIFLSYQLVINEKQNWKLQQEKRYLKEIEEVKNNFLSLISHDLKTPIAKIQGVAERLMATTLDDRVSSDLKIVKSSSQDLNRYIQTILQVTRVESTDFRARKQPADINQIVQKAVEDLTPLAREKSLTIDTNLEPLFSIELDATLIYEVVLNFIENAIKYSPPNRRIVVSSQETDNFVEVHVKDEGDGIPESEIQRVWNKFYRGARHGMVTKGSGLGLYLSKYFIDLHGGSVFMTSQVGKGTEVGFKLPIEIENEEKVENA